MRKDEKQVNILVSTCLVGVNTQCNEGCSRVDDIVTLVKSGKTVFLCPEQLGGLSTPKNGLRSSRK